MNNIGMTMLKDGMASEAKDFFERSYELKKTHATATRNPCSIRFTISSVSPVP